MFSAIARRFFLTQLPAALGAASLHQLIGSAEASSEDNEDGLGDPLAIRKPHFEPKAKAVIQLFMAGAPSQLELFDNKPTLTELAGKPLPPSVIGDQRYAFIQPDAAVLGPQFDFAKHGQSGAEISSALPHLASIADDICLIRSMHTDQFNHAPAQLLMNTGFSQPGRPSLGSWLLYGLGSETKELPSFVVMSTGDGISGGSSLWSSGFLPTVYTGVQFRSQGAPILNVDTPAGITSDVQRSTFELIQRMNQHRMDQLHDPEIATRIASFEMAARLQVQPQR